MLNPGVIRRRPSAAARILTVIAAVCVLVPLAGLSAPGQGLAGNFSGTVYDPSGAVVPNAVVTLTNNGVRPATKDTTTANAAGVFLFTNLPAGQYDMTVRMKGFAAANVKQVTLESGRDSAVNVNLEIGRVSEMMTVSASGTPRTAPAVTPGRIRVGGNVQAAQLISRVAPAYPPDARAAGIQGTVEMEAVIGKDGFIHSLQVISTAADPELVNAATAAVRQWRYNPTKLNGMPVEVITQIDVQFTLQP